MKRIRLGTSISIIVLAALLSTPAQSQRGMSQPGHFHSGPFHHHGHRVFVFVGAPIFWAWYQAPDAGYDEQIDASSLYGGAIDATYALPPQAYLYYCAEANAYYPYVSECLDGWQMLVPAPVE